MNESATPADEVDVAVVGAGSAGIAATLRLRAAGLSVALLEASHRIGGRAYTEELLPGVWFDLGCHWMHSASRNPFVQMADAHGFHYIRDSWPRELFLGERWGSEAEQAERFAFDESAYAHIDRLADEGVDVAVAEVTPRESRWTRTFDYIFSIINSVDVDQCSTVDVARYLDTGENWPLPGGYGRLLAQVAAGLEVTRNCRVERVHWGRTPLRLETAQGELRARRVLLTVSTGVLAVGDIDFRPGLPQGKQQAIHALPLGNHNRIAIALKRNPFGDEHPRGVMVVRDGTEPLGMQLRPFGQDYVVGVTGGRFASWLERAGVQASAELLREHLVHVFGADIRRVLGRELVTAWGGDPWVRGAYSAAQPGRGNARFALAEALDERLFFAGEATHSYFHATCHGAWLSGCRAARELMASLAGETTTIAPAASSTVNP